MSEYFHALRINQRQFNRMTLFPVHDTIRIQLSYIDLQRIGFYYITLYYSILSNLHVYIKRNILLSHYLTCISLVIIWSVEMSTCGVTYCVDFHLITKYQSLLHYITIYTFNLTIRYITIQHITTYYYFIIQCSGLA